MRQQHKQMKRFVLGFTALIIGMAMVQTSRADEIGPYQPVDALTRLDGFWRSVWSIDNTDVSVGMSFSPDGKCQLVMLNEKGDVIQQQTGSYTYEPDPQRIGLSIRAEGMLTLRIGGKQIEERVRWISSDRFVFVGSEEHPWMRIQLTE